MAQSGLMRKQSAIATPIFKRWRARSFPQLAHRRSLQNRPTSPDWEMICFTLRRLETEIVGFWTQRSTLSGARPHRPIGYSDRQIPLGLLRESTREISTSARIDVATPVIGY